MPISFTDKFNLDKEEYFKTGAFDVILDVDSRLFLDPALLESCTIKEFIGAKERVESYFADIITLLSHASVPYDIYWKKADKLLTFKEMSGSCFGYSQNGTAGNSIGNKLRLTILHTIKELVEKGEKDPTLFKLLGVFQEGIGCDRISDLLTFILAPDILAFTERVLEQFDLANTTTLYDGKSYKSLINQYNNKGILLLPSCLLSPLPVVNDYDDIDWICAENERVRQEINTYFDLDRRKKLTKTEIYSLMKSNPSFREALISAYKSAPNSLYDFDKDPAGEYIWYSVAKSYVSRYPLELQFPEKASISNIYDVVNKICEQFKSLIEDNGLWHLLYNDDKKPKHERAAQLLFFGIADSYCTSNDIDLSREINGGRGSVDFKLSQGAIGKILVEIKLTSNRQLQHGFTTQVPIYMKQEKTKKAVYLMIDNGHQKALDNFMKLYNSQSKEVKEKIQILVIDGIPPVSASRA